MTRNLMIAAMLACGLALAMCGWAQTGAPVAAAPIDNPVAKYGISWTAGLRWNNVLVVTEQPGRSLEEKLATAQEALAAQGGGVIFFPAGTYTFRDTIYLESGVILRGADPQHTGNALDAEYEAPTKFLFPRYKPTFRGNGTPNDTAFKGIHVEDVAATANCGVVNIDINHGHIEFGSSANFSSDIAAGKRGKNFIVYGCVIRNAAVPDAAIPMRQHPTSKASFQYGWQRWTQRHHAAIHIYEAGNILVANNRIPASGDDNFLMKDYRLYQGTPEGQGIKDPNLKLLKWDILFDYDNRAGIYVNAVGAMGGFKVWDPYLPEAKPASQPGPQALCKGIVIRNNYIYNTGSTGINTTGDGAYIACNIIRFKPNVVLPTARGYQLDHFTNNNRAIELRGVRWVVEGNDYEVYSNLVVPEVLKICTNGRHYGDGEGIMHESINNCGIVDSKLINNRGNRYLCIWRVPVDGLEIRGNFVPHIVVLARTNSGAGDRGMPVRNLRITGNTTYESDVVYLMPRRFTKGIIVTGGPGEDNIIAGNKHTQPDGSLFNDLPTPAAMDDNEGYTLKQREK